MSSRAWTAVLRRLPLWVPLVAFHWVVDRRDAARARESRAA